MALNTNSEVIVILLQLYKRLCSNKKNFLCVNCKTQTLIDVSRFVNYRYRLALRQGCHFIDILFAHADFFAISFLLFFFWSHWIWSTCQIYIWYEKILSDRQLDSKNRKKERDIWLTCTLDSIQDLIFYFAYYWKYHFESFFFELISNRNLWRLRIHFWSS